MALILPLMMLVLQQRADGLRSRKVVCCAWSKAAIFIAPDCARQPDCARRRPTERSVGRSCVPAKQTKETRELYSVLILRLFAAMRGSPLPRRLAALFIAVALRGAFGWVRSLHHSTPPAPAV